jgi:hypothetical protein
MGASTKLLEPVQACILTAIPLMVIILYGKKPSLFPLFFFLMEYVTKETPA